MLLEWQVATDYRNENSLLNSLAGAGPGPAGQYSGGGGPGTPPSALSGPVKSEWHKHREMLRCHFLDSWGHNLLCFTLILSSK